MTTAQIVAIIIAVASSGTIGAVVNGIITHRKGVRDTDLAREQTAVDGFEKLNGELRKDLTRLREDRERDSARIDAIERQIKVERDLKWDAIRYIRRLHEWIRAYLPSTAEIPPVPDSLTDHIPDPRKDPPS